MTRVLSAIERNRGTPLLFWHALVGGAAVVADGLPIDDLQQGRRIADLTVENPRMGDTEA